MKSDCKLEYISIAETASFSALVNDYINRNNAVDPFFSFTPDDVGIKEAISRRAQFPVDRTTLVRCIRKQYEGLEMGEAVRRNIELLSEPDTFTVCTAHQPNLMGGYLYFIYKIMHAVKLVQHLKQQHPEHHFVPVFYIGSEDNDFEELSVFRYSGKQYRWYSSQQGAVGRMQTKELKPLLDELFKHLGPPGSNVIALKELLLKAYSEQDTIADATRVLVHLLMGQYGIVVVDPDDADLKRTFRSIAWKELTEPVAYRLVSATSKQLSERYQAQAFVRPVNFFYLKDQVRERIEKQDDHWEVVHTGFRFNATQLEEELDRHPERFSPNVILRGLFQETILPNVAFIGGGSEVAYWLQLRSLFEHYGIFYPALILRQSVMWVPGEAEKLMRKSGVELKDIFAKTSRLQTQYTVAHHREALDISEATLALEQAVKAMKEQAMAIDPALSRSADAVLTKMNYQVDVLKRKMLRAAKRKDADQMNRISRLRALLFPEERLQERYDSFLQYYIDMGEDFFELLLEGTQPYGGRFLTIRC